MNETNLRQADAIVNVTAVLQEKNLKEELIPGTNVKHITGYLLLKTSDTDSISIGVNVAAKKKQGKEYSNEDNRNYAGIKTVMDEFQSVAEYGENADKVRIGNGTIRPYYDVRRDSEVVSYNSNFFTRVRSDDAKLSMDFEVELYISSIIPETYVSGENVGSETGRAIIKGWLPTYNGIEPMELVAPAEDGIADAIMSGDYQPGQTVRFFGNIINRRIVKTTLIPVKIGKPKEKTNVTYTNELVITGASEPYDTESSDPKANKPFEKAAVEMAINERKARIAEMKANHSTAPASGNAAAPASSGRKLPW